MICAVSRSTASTTTGLVGLKVGDTVNFRAGYKVYASASATTTTAASAATSDLSFIIMASAQNLAISAAVIALGVYAQQF